MVIAASDLEAGAEIGQYRVERLIGRGGMGTVYLAEHLRLQRKVALKVLVPDLAADNDFRERFIRESQLAASLEHPNIIPIYDADEHDGVLYLAMRYIDGRDLRELLTADGPLTPDQALDVLGQVASALDAAHKAGFVHRDVKPANILLERDGGQVYLSDFGLAKRTQSSGLTKTGSFLGSVDYCPPEQIEGGSLDGRADVYALGGVLFHCLTGQRPYPRETEMAVIKAHLVEPPPALSTVRPDLPRALDGVIATAMAKHPEVRYGSAGELIEAFRSAATRDRPTEGSPTVAETRPAEVVATVPMPVATQTSAGPTRVLHRAWLRPRAKRLIGGTLAVVLLVIAGLALIVAQGGGDATPRESESPAFNRQLAEAMSPVVPRQEAVSERVKGLEATSTSFDRLRSSAMNLERTILHAQGAVSALPPASSEEMAARRSIMSALAAHAAYARTLASLPPPQRFTLAAANTARRSAATAEGAYETASETVRELPLVPIDSSSHNRLTRVAETARKMPTDNQPRKGVGVPSVYTGLFTSVDRLQRCNATLTYVYCDSGPSGRALKLTAGVGITDFGVRGSTDRGGSSMAEGTSFRTPNGKIDCGSSYRGITCTDLTTGAYFVIGDRRQIIRRAGSPPTGSTAIPSRYSGYFAAVDRLERCYATDDFATCTAGPSGKGVRLVVGGGVSYDGITGSTDKGGFAMPIGSSFVTPAGRIRCGSSSKGITCTDLTTGAYFVIGDYLVRVNNGAGESIH